MKKIISTENFLIGLDKEKDEAVLGGLELYDNPNIDDNTIEFDECSWFDEKSYFFDGMIYDAIKRYEHRYKTTVTNIALIGTVGLWHGNPSGGVIFDSSSNPLDMMGDVDEIEVIVYDDGRITLQGIHHDGRHVMEMYFLTESKLNKYAPDYLQFGDYDVDDLARIKNHTSSVKYDKYAVGYFGKLQSKTA